MTVSTDQTAHKADSSAVCGFVQTISDQARAAAGETNGLLQISRLHPDTEDFVPRRYGVGDVDRIHTVAQESVR
jgi:hypothetical protein